MHLQFETIDGLQIHYRRHHKPYAPTLVLTNAWPMSIRCWDSTWDALARSFNLLAFDLPGFGLSDGSLALMRPSAQGQFLLKLLDHFQFGQIHGIGPDVGVPVMLWFAHHQPERLHSIIIFNGPGFYPPYISWELRTLIRSPFLRNVIGQTGNLFAAIAMRRGYRQFKPTREALEEYRIFNGNGTKFRLTLAYLASYPTELSQIGKYLASTQCPVLLLWGDKDPFIKTKNARVLHKKLPKCHYHPLTGCGHFAHEDAGDVFVEAVSRWCFEEFEQAR